MNKLMIVLSLTFLSLNSLADVLSKNTAGDYVITKSTFKVSELLNDYVKLEKLSLILGDTFKDEEFVAVGNKEIVKDHFKNYLSSLLYQSENTIVMMPDNNLLHVVSNREARYMALPLYKTVEDIPPTYNFVQFTYHLKYIKAEELARNLRPLLSRHGRLIDDLHSNSINISDRGVNIKRMLAFIQYIDTERFAEDRKKADEINEKNVQILKDEKTLFQILTSHQGLFLIAFFLLGGIIGFGWRGYMMKKIEGGW